MGLSLGGHDQGFDNALWAGEDKKEGVAAK